MVLGDRLLLCAGSNVSMATLVILVHWRRKFDTYVMSTISSI